MPEEKGGGIRVVDRTNNILESSFRGIKHDERRRSGREILTQDFEWLSPEVALVYNLNRLDYVSIVCGSLGLLYKAFARIDLDRARSTDDSEQRAVGKAVILYLGFASLPSVDRKLIRKNQMKNELLQRQKAEHRISSVNVQNSGNPAKN